MHQLQVFTKRICQSILDTKLHIHNMHYSHICHFRPTTQPNPLKTQISTHSRPNPTQTNPTRGSTNPRTTLIPIFTILSATLSQLSFNRASHKLLTTPKLCKYTTTLKRSTGQIRNKWTDNQWCLPFGFGPLNFVLALHTAT